MVTIRIRIKKQYGGFFNKTIKIDSSSHVEEVDVNTDIMQPENEVVSLFFRGNNCSGIIDMKPEEIERLYATLRGRMNLVKGIKKFKDKA